MQEQCSHAAQGGWQGAPTSMLTLPSGCSWEAAGAAATSARCLIWVTPSGSGSDASSCTLSSCWAAAGPPRAPPGASSCPAGLPTTTWHSSTTPCPADASTRGSCWAPTCASSAAADSHSAALQASQLLGSWRAAAGSPRRPTGASDHSAKRCLWSTAAAMPAREPWSTHAHPTVDQPPTIDQRAQRAFALP